MKWSGALCVGVSAVALSAVVGCCIDETSSGKGCDPTVEAACVCKRIDETSCSREENGCICALVDNNNGNNGNNGNNSNNSNNGVDAGDDADTTVADDVDGDALADVDLDVPSDVDDVAEGLADADDADDAVDQDGADAVDDVDPQPERVRYVMTIQNLSRQPLGPVVAITHGADVHFWREGEQASAGIQAIAERGAPFTFFDEVVGQPGVTEVINRGIPMPPAGVERPSYGPFPPGLTLVDRNSLLFEGQPGDVLTLASMLVATNDGFWGLDSVELPASGMVVYFADAWDAGTEDNTEQAADLDDNASILGRVELPGDPNGNAGTVTSPQAAITRHEGVQGANRVGSELTVAEHGWGAHVARIIIAVVPEGADRSYEVFVQNTTHQPLGPCVAVAHDPTTHAWQLGQTATPGIQTIGERGNPADLLAEMALADGVTQAVTSALPMTPMDHQAMSFGTLPPDVEIYDHIIFPLSADSNDMFTLASMLVATNDGFWGFDGVALPETGVAELQPAGYDAGTEDNTELSTHLDDAVTLLSPTPLTGDPNGNGGDVTDPRGVITVHPGIQEVGDLTAAANGWDMNEPVAQVRVERLERRIDPRCLEGAACP